MAKNILGRLLVSAPRLENSEDWYLGKWRAILDLGYTSAHPAVVTLWRRAWPRAWPRGPADTLSPGRSAVLWSQSPNPPQVTRMTLSVWQVAWSTMSHPLARRPSSAHRVDKPCWCKMPCTSPQRLQWVYMFVWAFAELARSPETTPSQIQLPGNCTCPKGSTKQAILGSWTTYLSCNFKIFVIPITKLVKGDSRSTSETVLEKKEQWNTSIHILLGGVSKTRQTWILNVLICVPPKSLLLWQDSGFSIPTTVLLREKDTNVLLRESHPTRPLSKIGQSTS